MSSETRLERLCRNCDALPKARVSHAENHRLPRSWRPIDEHPTLVPGPWVPRGDMKGLVFCDSCGTLWLLFLDPAQDYYTDVIELAPELFPIVSQDATLGDVLPLAVSADSLLQLMIRDWFALADYAPGDAAQALIGELAREDLSTRTAVRLLDFLAAVLAGSGRRRSVTVGDPWPLVDLLERDDFLSLDEVRRASEMHEIRRALAGIVRAAFGSAFGADHDRMQTRPEAREALLGRVVVRESGYRPPVLAPPGVAPNAAAQVGPYAIPAWASSHPDHSGAEPVRLAGIEGLVSEIEDLLREGVSRITSQEIAPIVTVVRSFWEQERGAHPRRDPGLSLYRRCRDLLLALRSADLIPNESEEDVDDALAAG